jgi:hypothetical protein
MVSTIAEEMKWEKNLADSHADLEHANELRLVAQNPMISDRRWEEDDRLEKVIAQYRAVGAAQWTDARDKDNNIIQLTSENFSEESEFGYYTAYWNYGPLQDGMYQVRWRSVCLSTNIIPQPGVDFDTSVEITGRIDREPPQQFGVMEPADGIYRPGSEISVTYQEPLFCIQPFPFEVELTIDGINGVFHSRDNNMVIVCEGRKLGVSFMEKYISFSDVAGRKAEVVFKGIWDEARNEIPEDLKLKFAFATIDITATQVKASAVRYNVSYLELDPDEAAYQQNLQVGIAQVLSISPTRVTIDNFRGDSTSETGTTLFDLTLNPDPAGDAASVTASRLMLQWNDELTEENPDYTINQYMSAILPEAVESELVVLSANDQYVENTAKCAAAELTTGDVAVSGDTVELTITARNPSAITTWRSDQNILLVRPVYRTHGSSWSPCLMMDGNELDLTNDEDERGFAARPWDVSTLPDGEYEIAIETNCAIADAPSYSHISRVVLDRQGPLAVSKFIHSYYPGDSLVFKFSEPIVCSADFAASFVWSHEGTQTTTLTAAEQDFMDASLSASCFKNFVVCRLDFLTHVDAGVDIDAMFTNTMGQNMFISLAGVTDIHGNSASPVDDFTVASYALDEVSVVLQWDIDQFYASQNDDNLYGEVEEAFGSQLVVPESRMEAFSTHVNPDGKTTCVLTINPSVDGGKSAFEIAVAFGLAVRSTAPSFTNFDKLLQGSMTYAVTLSDADAAVKKAVAPEYSVLSVKAESNESTAGRFRTAAVHVPVPATVSGPSFNLPMQSAFLAVFMLVSVSGAYGAAKCANRRKK